MIGWKPLLGTSIAAYGAWMWWRLGFLRRATKSCKNCGPRWLAKIACSISTLMARLAGVRVASIEGEGLQCRDGRRLMYVWHPHGFVAYTPAMIMGDYAVRGFPHGKEWYGTCAPLLFNIPILGEHFMLTNARSVDRKSLEAILGNGGTIAIQPGGVKEQARSRHDQEQAFFPTKLGFVRLAIKHGTDLMPVYIFGENQLYRRVEGFDWLSRLINKVTGMTLPIVTAKWGLPQAGFMPIATDLHIRYGNPVEVGKPEDEPSDERVEAVFASYLKELNRLFDANKDACLPPEIAAKGLEVKRI